MSAALTHALAAAALGAVGFAESAFMFAWPLWASAALGCAGLWAGLIAFQPVDRPPRNGPRGKPRSARIPAKKPCSRK